MATFWSLCLLSGTKSLLCADTLWHIKVGEIILSSGQILTHDIFSHTVAGKPWTAHEWLAEIFMALCYKLGGLPAVTIAFFAMAGITITLLFKASQKLSSEWSAFFAVTIAATFAQTHLLARPHIFTWLFGSIVLYLLINQDRKIWLLPVITALWGNLHGGVLLGLVLQGGFLLGSYLDNCTQKNYKTWAVNWPEIKRPFYVFLLSLLALGFNPYGYSLLLFPFQVSAEVFSQNIVEWIAPDLQKMWYVRLWIIMLGVLIATQKRRFSWTWAMFLIFFIYEALGHIRHLSIAAMFLAPWTAMALHDLTRRTRHHKPKPVKELVTSQFTGFVLIIASFVLLFSFSITQPSWWLNFTKERFALPGNYSTDAINYLKEHGYPGERLLNEYSWGGFLLFSLDPPPKVFIDGRADMYGETVFSDYGMMTNASHETEKLLSKYMIDWIIYPKGSTLIRYLKSKVEWEEIYTDDKVVILTLKKTPIL